MTDQKAHVDIVDQYQALDWLIRRFSSRSALSSGAIDAVRKLQIELMHINCHSDVLRVSEKAGYTCLVAKGLVTRFKQLRDGNRQTFSVHIPGDLVDAYSLILPRTPASFQISYGSTIILLPHAALRLATARFPELLEALWRETIVDAAIMEQRVVSLGRRDARTRIAHLLCEMAVRYQWIGAFEDNSYHFSVSQEQLGDMLGLTSVHVNRMLRQLREERLVTMAHARVEILDWTALIAAGGFNPTYLCLPGSEKLSFGPK